MSEHDAPRTLIGVSVTAHRAEALRANGPQRDFDALAEHVGGTIIYQANATILRGWLGRLFGAHVRQAWRIARGTRPDDVLFADGEHLGLPLLLFVHLLRRHPRRLVMLGHLPGRWWKRIAFRALTQTRFEGVVLTHSLEQGRLVRGWLGRNWSMNAIPYQVDTAFWSAAPTATQSLEMPLVLAVGSEARDYETLVQALGDVPTHVVVAAGSHWARSIATVEALPANIEYISDVLNFAALRELYRRASIVVVPLHDVANQSGVTTILEAMSVGRPVIVTASRGQRECVTGPMVLSTGEYDAAITRDRGSQLFGGLTAEMNGLYVSPADSAALREAVVGLMGNAELAESIGVNGASEARRTFTIERFVSEVAAALRAPVATSSGISQA